MFAGCLWVSAGGCQADNKNDFVDIFLSVSPEEKEKMLDTLGAESVDELRDAIKAGYRNAVSLGTKSLCKKSLVVVSAYIIKKMPIADENYARGLARNVLIFMSSNIMDVNDIAPENRKIRDAYGWSGQRALIEGNSNGCVEKARIFLELIRVADKSLKCYYRDSFNLEWAVQAGKSNDWANPAGHAVVEIKGEASGEYLLIDPSANVRDLDFALLQSDKQRKDVLVKNTGDSFVVEVYNYSKAGDSQDKILTKTFSSLVKVNRYLKKFSLTVTESDFGFVKMVNDGIYALAGERYVLFGQRSLECPFAKELGDGNGAEATIAAARKYLANR